MSNLINGVARAAARRQANRLLAALHPDTRPTAIGQLGVNIDRVRAGIAAVALDEANAGELLPVGNRINDTRLIREVARDFVRNNVVRPIEFLEGNARAGKSRRIEV